MAQIKEDCVNYVKLGKKIHQCNCLKSLYCEHEEECAFYKTNKDFKMEYDKAVGLRVPTKRWKI